MCIEEEKGNVVDSNALRVDVEFSNELKPIGYIPGQHIRMVKRAMDRKEIISAKISSITILIMCPKKTSIGALYP